MINLIKYEFVKTRKILLISAAVLGVSELLYIFSSLVKWELMYTFSAVLMAVFTVLPVLFPLFYSLHLYYKDINRSHNNGYMLFMTANSPYKIIGAKISASMIVCVALLIFMNIESLINSRLPAAFVQKELIDNDIFSIIAGGMADKVNFGSIFLLCIAIAAHTANMIAAVYFAKMLGDTVWNESEHKNAFVFVTGAVLLFVSGLTVFIICVNAIVKSDITGVEIFSALNSSLIGVIIISVAFFASEYYATSRLCMKKFEL